LNVVTVRGEQIALGGPCNTKKGQLLLFVSPSCPMCAQILQMLRSFWRAEREAVEIVLIGDGSREAYLTLTHQYGISELPLVLDSTVGLRYQVGKLPYAMFIDSSGVMRSAGLVNSREHLESLVLADEKGVASVQEYLRATTGILR
jgi:methylamine dehydrogenase accessory protein MauD